MPSNVFNSNITHFQAYLQELLGNVEEYQPSFTNCVLELDSGMLQGDESCREVQDEEADNNTYENITVHLHNNNTNSSMQVAARGIHND